jgi:hypothetical protein
MMLQMTMDMTPMFKYGDYVYITEDEFFQDVRGRVVACSHPLSDDSDLDDRRFLVAFDDEKVWFPARKLKKAYK